MDQSSGDHNPNKNLACSDPPRIPVCWEAETGDSRKKWLVNLAKSARGPTAIYKVESSKNT